MANQNPQSKKPAKSNLMTWVLLGITACVVGVTIYVAKHKLGRTVEPDVVTPRATEAEQVIAQVARNQEAARRSPLQQAPLRQALYQASRDLMESYVRMHPDDAEVRPHLADLLLKMGNPEAAQKVADVLLELRPQSAEGLWIMGLCMKAMGQEGYERLFEQAAASPDARASIWARYGAELLGQRKLAEAETYLNKAYQAGARDAATLGGLARFALRQKRLEDADNYLSQAVRDEAAEPVTWWMLASVQKDRGKLDEAATSIREAIRLLAATAGPAYQGPSKEDMLMLLGRVRVLQNRSQEAADAFTAAAGNPLVRPQATFEAAQCWYAVGRYAPALECIDTAEKLLPGDPAVAWWKKKIEDARFPHPTTATSATSAP
jgi:tetratricopeptide (TPR) repeat protein